MSGVFAQLSMSLDGFVAGPDDRPGNPLGDGGGRVHEWLYATSSWQRIHGREGPPLTPRHHIRYRRAPH